MGLIKFRTARRVYMIVSMLCSILTFALAHALRHSFAHNSDALVLIIISPAIFFSCAWIAFRKVITHGRSQQLVRSDIAWTFCMVPSQFILALLSLSAPKPQHTPIMGMLFCALRVIIWANCAFILSYLILLSAVTTLTQYAFDPNVWTRVVDSDPSPFPFYVIFFYAFPFLERFIPENVPISPVTPRTDIHAYCLPGCTCSRKLSVSASPPRLDRPPPLMTRARCSYASSSASTDGFNQASISVRLPTDMDRRRSIVVSLDGLGGII